MRRLIHLLILILALIVCRLDAPLRADDVYRQQQNIVFAEVHGIGLVMDVFVPAAEKNGLGIIDVISGAWYSDRGKIRDHQQAQMYDIFCGRGYTVFAVRPGSVSKFTGLEMLDHLQQGIRWVKDHAAEYGVDPARLGMTGASAGGHLASLAAVAGSAERSMDTSVHAVGVFFPPTDLIAFAGGRPDLRDGSRISAILRAIGFNDRLEGVTDQQIADTLIQLSPARRVSGNEPAFLLIHGDADTVVPLKQSEMLLEALKSKAVPARLIVKEGGAHPWPTIHEEVAVLADWFDEQLASP
jgi:acetyl esterase/lipase